jgi:hypothetical protein
MVALEEVGRRHPGIRRISTMARVAEIPGVGKTKLTISLAVNQAVFAKKIFMIYKRSL